MQSILINKLNNIFNELKNTINNEDKELNRKYQLLNNIKFLQEKFDLFLSNQTNEHCQKKYDSYKEKLNLIELKQIAEQDFIELHRVNLTKFLKDMARMEDLINEIPNFKYNKVSDKTFNNLKECFAELKEKYQLDYIAISSEKEKNKYNSTLDKTLIKNNNERMK